MFTPSFESNQRLQELQPALSRCAQVAILAYDALQPPVDQPAGQADEQEAPARWEDFLLAGRVVGRYVRVAFEPNHRISLYRNRRRNNVVTYDWQFCRVYSPVSSETEVTRVTKFPALRDSDQASIIDIRVDKYTNSDAAGRNGEHMGNVCAPENNYHDAERYIADFIANIENAANSFGG